MPELPDVQVLKAYVDATALHQRIRGVGIDADGLLEDVSRRTLGRHLRGHRLEATRRHGKHLFVSIGGDDWLRLHFGMTGALAYFKQRPAQLDHVRLRLDFANGYHLAYRNTRGFGAIGLVDDVDAFVAAAHLGPDPLADDFDLGAFRQVLAERRGPIKRVLMDQSVLAGVGNVYADEILFRAGLRPTARTERLRGGTVKRLYHALGTILRRAISARGDVDRMPRSFLLPRRRPGGECPRCGRTLRITTVSGRTTYWCPRHQRRTS